MTISGTCVRCVSRRRVGLKLLGGSVDYRPLVNLRREDGEAIRALKTSFADADELRRLVLGEFDIGWAVLSTLATWVRHPRPDTVAHADDPPPRLVGGDHVLLDAEPHRGDLARARLRLQRTLDTARAVLRASQLRGVDCFMHERGSTPDRYALFKNRMLHDPAFYRSSFASSGRAPIATKPRSWARASSSRPRAG